MGSQELLALALRRKWVLLAVVAGTIACHCVILHSQPERFRSETLLQIRTHAPEKLGLATFDGLQVFEPFDASILPKWAATRGFRERVSRLLEGEGESAAAATWGPARLTLERADSGAESRLVYARYEAAAADHVRPALLASCRVLAQLAREHFHGGISAARKRLETLVERERTTVARFNAEIEAERALLALPNPDADLGEEHSSLRRAVDQLETKQFEAHEAVAAARDKLAAYATANPAPEVEDDLDLLTLLEGTPVYRVISALAAKLADDEIALLREQGVKTDIHPDIRALVGQLDNERALFACAFEESSPFYPHIQRALAKHETRLEKERALLGAEAVAAAERVARIEALLSEKRSLLERVEGTVRRIAAIERDRSVAASAGAGIAENLRRLDSFARIAPEVLEFSEEIDAAQPAGVRLTSHLWVVIGTALLLGIASALAVEGLDRRVHDETMLRRHAGLPIAGLLPRMDRALPLGNEAFAALLKKILVQLDGANVLLVAGPAPGAGATHVATHLALAASRVGLRTLLVEADLRRPRLAAELRVRRAPGLAELATGLDDEERDALAERLESAPNGERDIRMRLADLPWPAARGGVALLAGRARDRLTVQATIHPGLFLVASGDAEVDPAALLESAAMTRFLAWARREYSLVVIDAPPLDRFADALLLAGRADATLLVVGACRTTHDQLVRARQALADVNARVLGCVLNGDRGRSVSHERA